MWWEQKQTEETAALIGGLARPASCSLALLLFRRAVFQNVAGLALEMFADGFERGEADGLGLAGFEDGQVLRGDVHAVGQIVEPHFPLGENHVEIDDDALEFMLR